MDRTLVKKPWHWRPATFLAGAAWALALGVVAKIDDGQQQLRGERGSPRLGEVGIQPFRETVIASGTVQPRRLIFED